MHDAYKIVKELKNDIIHKSSEKSTVKVIIKKILKKLVNYDILHLYEFLDVNSQNNLSENYKTIVKRYIFSTFKEEEDIHKDIGEYIVDNVYKLIM